MEVLVSSLFYVKVRRKLVLTEDEIRGKFINIFSQGILSPSSSIIPGLHVTS